MVFTHSPDGGGGTTSNYNTDSSLNSDYSQQQSTGAAGSASAPESGGQYAYIDNNGNIQQNSSMVNVNAEGDAYDTTTGTILAGPNTGGSIDPNTGAYSTGANVSGVNCAFCNSATAFLGSYGLYLLIGVVLIGVLLMRGG
jgi:hypothetical protein